MKLNFIDVAVALDDLRKGKLLILVDDEDRENEGDLIVAAEKITPDMVNFMRRNTCGLICLPMAGTEIDRLKIPMMVEENRSNFQTAFTTTIEAATGVTTGVSASDRAHTIRTAIDPKSTPADIVMPGHILPLRAKEGGVLVRAGHTEGSVDLAQLAGLRPACAICEITNEDGEMARLPDLQAFSQTHGINMVSINDIIAYRMRHECFVDELAECTLPIEPYGEFKVKVFVDKLTKTEHVALIRGELDNHQPTLVRVHSACLTGDAFGSARCDCGWQLQAALKTIAEQGGVLLYMHQEGRGIGLANKIKSYALQEQGMDTVEANNHLGFHADHRDYGIGSQILRYLGLSKMRLLTNNPKKIYGIHGYGIEIVSREPIEMTPTKENVRYLTTKRLKLGHLLNKIGS